MGGESEKEKIQDFDIKELQRDFSRMNGILFGQNGMPGAISRIEKSQVEVLKQVGEIKDEIHSITIQHITDITSIKKDVAENRDDINSIGEIARQTRDLLNDKPRQVLRIINRVIWPLVGAGIIGLIVTGFMTIVRDGGL